MNIILGNGISSYTAAACLEYKNEQFKIYANDYNVKIPEILFLRCENYEEIDKYLSIFNIKEKQNEFVQKIKVGYFYDDRIHEYLTENAKKEYFKKQNRSQTKSSLSDGKNEYMAINLSKVLTILKNRYSICDIRDYKINDDDFVYDTINVLKLPIKFENYGKEYVTKNNFFDVKQYDYVYDCSKSKIKRYTSSTVEYLSKEKDSIEIINYYDSPTFYKNGNVLLISRYATKSQIKQKDIIDLIIDGKGEVKDV